MATRVLKFGGTSLATPARVQAAARQVAAAHAAGDEIAVVVSAMGHTTDRLLDLAERVVRGSKSPRELDALLATGEMVSAALFAMALRSMGVAAESRAAARTGLRTDCRHGNATILAVEAGGLDRALREGRVPVVTGFQGVDDHGDLTTLGRGGSDTTAVALAAALAALRHEPVACEILTDVRGVCTADPRIVTRARLIRRIDAAAMLQLARAGAAVMHAEAIRLALRHGQVLTVREAHPRRGRPLSGTIIEPDPLPRDRPIAVATSTAWHRLRLDGDDSAVGGLISALAARIDGSLAAADGILIPESSISAALEMTRAAAGELVGPLHITHEPEVAVVSLVGGGELDSGEIEAPMGWWDGDPATAWWSMPASAAVGFATRLHQAAGLTGSHAATATVARST